MDVSINQPSEEARLVEQAVAALSEHFENVHVFVSKMRGDIDRTMTINKGAGNWHARFGQINEYVIYEEERIRIAARKTEEEQE